MSLPPEVIFSLRNSVPASYLCFTGPRSLLRYSDEEGVFSPTAKFAVEEAANGLVHIRSVYHSYYWVRAAASEQWLTASAPEPIDDPSAEKCTLFRPEISPGHSVRFIHVQSGLNVAVRPSEDAFPFTLCVANDAPVESDYINFETLIKLPRYVAFKPIVDPDNGYLGILDGIMEDNPIMCTGLGQNDVVNTSNLWFETVVSRTGDIQVKSFYLNKFWRYNNTLEPQHIASDPPHPSPNNLDTLFGVSSHPTKPNSNVVVLRSRANDQFCGPTNMMFTYLPLLIFSATYNEPVEFGVDELVKSRTVHVKSFRRGRVYNLRSTQLISKSVTNTSDQAQDFELTAPCTFTKRYTFTNDVTVPTNLVSEFRSRIPYISDNGKVVIPDGSIDFQGKWGVAMDYTNNADADRKVTVPARTTATVSMAAKTATCQIPFSYEQVDEVFDGNMYPETLYDGIFTGEYMYDIEVNIDRLEPL